MSSEPTRVAQDEAIERVNQLLEEDDWYIGDRVPPALADVAETLAEGFSALNAAYCVGDEGAYEHACAAFARAEAVCADRPALYWYLARLYADHGFFDERADL